MSYRETFGPYRDHVFGWLKLVYWDNFPQHPEHTLYSFQLCAADDPSMVPLDFQEEGVKLYMATLLTGDWELCTPDHDLVSPPGISIRVQYPRQRGVHTSPLETLVITFPGHENRVQL